MNELLPPKRVLLGPGPSDADPRVLAAMSKPLLGHLDPAFLQVMDDIQQSLRFRKRQARSRLVHDEQARIER